MEPIRGNQYQVGARNGRRSGTPEGIGYLYVPLSLMYWNCLEALYVVVV